MKETESAVLSHSTTKGIEQRSFDVPAQVMRLDTNMQPDLQRHVAGQLDLNVVAHAAVEIEILLDLLEQFRVGSLTTEGIDRHVSGVPASGPLQGRARALHFTVRITFGEASIVIRRDSAFELFEKCCRSKQLRLCNRFERETAARRQRISRAQLHIVDIAPAHGRDYIGADVARWPISNPINCAKD